MSRTAKADYPRPLLDFLDRYIEEHSLSRNELAMRIGISSAAMSQLFTGKSRFPDLQTVVGIAEATGLDPADVIHLATGWVKPAGNPLLSELSGVCRNFPEGRLRLMIRLALAVSRG